MEILENVNYGKRKIVENVNCGKCELWKMENEENQNYGRLNSWIMGIVKNEIRNCRK